MKVFLSYTRRKDEFNAVSAFRQHLENELNNLDPDSTVFQDKESIGSGDHFLPKTLQELAASDLLLVLLSPAWLKSKWCRWEYETFTAKKKESGQSSRVLPVLWVRTLSVEDPRDDAIAQELAQIQYTDWHDVRHENWTNPDILRQVAKLAARAVALVRKDKENPAEPLDHLRLGPRRWQVTGGQRRVAAVAAMIGGAVLGALAIGHVLHRDASSASRLVPTAKTSKTLGKAAQTPLPTGTRPEGAIPPSPQPVKRATPPPASFQPQEFPLGDGESRSLLHGRVSVRVAFHSFGSTEVPTLYLDVLGRKSKQLPLLGTSSRRMTFALKGTTYAVAVVQMSQETKTAQIRFEAIGARD